MCCRMTHPISNLEVGKLVLDANTDLSSVKWISWRVSRLFPTCVYIYIYIYQVREHKEITK
jgi:hypothetical protein